jgi:hypothetical protein
MAVGLMAGGEEASRLVQQPARDLGHAGGGERVVVERVERDHAGCRDPAEDLVEDH